MTFFTSTTELVVPEGHRVCGYELSLEPRVHRCEGGLVVAHFGLGGDDPEEVFEVVQSAATELQRFGATRSTITFVDTPTALSDLFSATPPATRTVRSAVAWTVCQDGLQSVLQDTTLRQRLISELHHLPAERQWFVVDPSWGSETEFEDGLQALEIDLFQTPGDRPFLFEVLRPDGQRVCGFVGRELVPAAPRGPRPLIRSTRLRRSILDACAARGPDAAFYRELLSREFPLVFLVDAAGKQARTMTFHRTAGRQLPVFADLRSAERTAKEIGLKPGTYGYGALGPRELFRWARESRFGVILGAFEDEGGVRYLRLDLSCTAPQAEGPESAAKRTEALSLPARPGPRRSLLAAAIVALLLMTDLGLMFTVHDQTVLRVCLVLLLPLVIAAYVVRRA
jgi:hypothetical protein